MQSIEKVAWGNRGYDDAFKTRPRRTKFPSEEARRVYNERYLVGERQRAKGENDERSND